MGQPWRALGTTSTTALGRARRELHWAATAVEQVGKALVAPSDDYSHTAFRWSPEHAALVTAPTPSGARAALRPAMGELLALDPSGAVVDEHPLAGSTLDEAAAWVREHLGPIAGAEPDWQPLRRDGLPRSGVAEGSAFTPAGAEHHELASWYANAALVLEQIRGEHEEAGPVLCWPHHLDIATRLDFEPDADPETARSVGLGFSPGDEGTPQPYFYVLPWPAPDPADLPPLGGFGGWVTEDWVGGCLEGSDVVQLDGIAQAQVVEMFLSDGVEAAKSALGL